MAKASFNGMLVIEGLGIAVKAYNVAKSKSDDDIEFHTYHKECLTPIEKSNFCPTCNVTLGKDLIVKGYEDVEGTQKLVRTVSDEEIDMLKPKAEESRPIYVVSAINPQEIDPIWMSQSYFLVPNPDVHAADDCYTLFAQGLTASKLWTSAEYISHGHSHLGIIRPLTQGLVLTTLHYPDLMNTMADLGYESVTTKHEFKRSDVQKAKTHITKMLKTFQHGKYSDVWVTRVKEFREKKQTQAPYFSQERPVGRVNPFLVKNLEKSLEMLREEKKAAAKEKGRKRRAS